MLGVLTASIMVMVSMVVPMVDFVFYGDSTLDPFIERLTYDDDKRLLGLKITITFATSLVLNVYSPYQSDDNVIFYHWCL